MPEVSSIGSNPIGPLDRGMPPPVTSENGALQNQPSQPVAEDKLELSDRARLLDPAARLNRVEAARQAIREGRYETEERLNIAIERLLDDLR